MKQNNQNSLNHLTIVNPSSKYISLMQKKKSIRLLHIKFSVPAEGYPLPYGSREGSRQ